METCEFQDVGVVKANPDFDFPGELLEGTALSRRRDRERQD